MSLLYTVNAGIPYGGELPCQKAQVCNSIATIAAFFSLKYFGERLDLNGGILVFPIWINFNLEK